MQQKKSNRIPIQLQLMRWIFPVLEKIFPSLMKRLYVKLFFSPVKFPFKLKEKNALRKSKIWSIKYKNKVVKIYKWGNGPKQALFVHGWSGRGAQGYAFAERFLDQDYTFFAFDLPAHGHSSGTQTNIFETTEIISEITDTFGEFECIIGHSFGGVVATYAMTKELPFKKLILIGSPHSTDFVVTEFAKAIGASGLFEKSLENYVHEKWDMTFDDMSIHNMIQSVDQDDVLIIHDQNDKEVPFDLTALTLSKSKDAAFIATQGLGHKRILQNADVIDSVLDFTEKGSREVILHLN